MFFLRILFLIFSIKRKIRKIIKNKIWKTFFRRFKIYYFKISINRKIIKIIQFEKLFYYTISVFLFIKYFWELF